MAGDPRRLRSHSGQLGHNAERRRTHAELEELFRRELPLLRRWAFAHVPASIRRSGDTDDFVQVALLRTLRRLPHLRACDSGTLQPYMRRVLKNLVRDHARAGGRRPEMRPIEEWDESDDSSHLDRMIASEAYARYRAAVAKLSPRAQIAVRARIEQGLDYEAVARHAQCASPAAARIMVGRALNRVAADLRAADARRRR